MTEGTTPHSLSEDEQALAAGYVLGDLSVAELEQVERLLQHRPDLQQEICSMQISFQLLPQTLVKVQPPPQLQARILAANTSATTPPSTQSRPRLFSWLKVLAGLGLLTTLLVGFDNWRLRQQLRLAEQANVERVAAILQRPNSRLVALEGQDSNAAGTLMFTPGRWQEVVVSLGNLPPLPPDQVYRLWLTLQNEETIFCGEFNSNAQGSVFLRLTPPETPPQGMKATGIFVTIDAPDNPLEPTGKQILRGSI